MRCIVVNGSKLKAECCCANCGARIAESYLRDIRTRAVYCDLTCYGIAAQTAALALDYRTTAVNAWPRS
jgi:hypothetical protein